MEYKLISTGSAAGGSFSIEELGASGSRNSITTVIDTGDGSGSDEVRLSDKSERTFQVDILLTKYETALPILDFGFTEEDGGSHLVFPNGSGGRFTTTVGCFELKMNSSREAAMVAGQVVANSSHEAMARLCDSASIVLDHLSYIAGVPVRMGTVRVTDEKNLTTTIDVISPDRPYILVNAERYLFPELVPIYALYRESKNSHSPFYKILCLFKVLEGIFGVLRGEARKRADFLGVALDREREFVPDHPDISDELKQYVGWPMVKFYNDILQKEYRDVVAHFLKKDIGVLHVGASGHVNRFVDMAFLFDLCVQVVVENHEELLMRIENLGART